MFRYRWIPCLFALIALSSPSSQVHSAVIQVPADQPTIQAGLDVAAEGDTVLLSPGTYTGDGNRELTFGGVDKVLLGEAGYEVTIIDIQGSWANRHCAFLLEGVSRNAVIQGLTISNGYGEPMETGGGINLSEASPTLIDLDIASCRVWDESYGAGLPGAAIRSTNSSPLIKNVYVHDTGGSCAIYLGGGAPELEDVRIWDCTDGEYSGTGALVCSGSDAKLTRVRMTGISGGWYSGGGAMSIYGDPAPVFRECVFREGYNFPHLMEGGTGGLLNILNSSPLFIDCQFIRGFADLGGAIYIDGGEPSFQRVLFEGNHGNDGAVMHIVAGNVEVDGITCVNNGGDWLAGAPDPYAFGSTIFCRSNANLSMSNSIIASTLKGPGLHADEGAQVDVSCSDFFDNIDGNVGGSIGDILGIDGNFSDDPLFCDAANSDFTLDSSSPCQPDGNDCGILIGAFGVGCGDPTGAGSELPAAPIGGLTVHPNPFNPGTRIQFTLPSEGRVSLKVFGTSGRLLRTLVDEGLYPAGISQVSWDGRDDANQALPSGVYYCAVEMSGAKITRKMVLLK